MLDEKVIDIVRRIFFDHDCIMTTAELNSYKLYYADIQKLLDEGLIEKIKWGYYHWVDSFDGQEVKIINRLFQMQSFVWKQLSFIIIIATVILPNGILRLIKMFQGIVQR